MSAEARSPEALIEKLREWVKTQRETAAIWEEQLTDSYYIERGLRPLPPTYQRADIRNWINWLRSQASEIEAVVLASSAEAAQPGEKADER